MTPVGSGDPLTTAQAFLGAVAWADHTTVWELLAPTARHAVLELATRRGMDPLLAARLREGAATTEERDDFLADLLHGLRAEVAGVDLETVRCVVGEGGTTVPGSVLVRLVADVPAELGAAVPVGRIEVVRSGGRWAVVRLDGAS